MIGLRVFFFFLTVRYSLFTVRYSIEIKKKKKKPGNVKYKICIRFSEIKCKRLRFHVQMYHDSDVFSFSVQNNRNKKNTIGSRV